MNSRTDIVDELECAKDDEYKGKTTKEYQNLMEESISDTKTYAVKFHENYSSTKESSNLLCENHLIDELLFGEKRSTFAYTNQVEDNLFAVIELGKEVEDKKQPVVIATEVSNEDYFPIEEEGRKDEQMKALLEEKNEKNQYGSSYDFSYDHNNVLECVGLQDNNPFSVVIDYEEDMEENEEIDEENIKSIFMVWSIEEIKYYYEFMLQKYIEQDIDDCLQRGKQHTYEELEEFPNIKDKRLQEFVEVLTKKNDSQQPSSKMQKKKVMMTVKQIRVKMKHIWSSKPGKKLHCHHYWKTTKVNIKFLESSCKPSRD